MSDKYRVYSADDHVQEPPDLWTDRLSHQQWGDRVPHIARQPNGADRWVIDGAVKEARALSFAGAMAAERFQGPQTWAEVPAAAHDPAARLTAMDRDGVDLEVLYPLASGVGGDAFGYVEDGALEVACVQAYNDWLVEVWAKASPRFVPQCVLPISSIEAAVAELERAVKIGHKGAIMTALPWHVRRELPHLYNEDWDPLWAKAVDLDVPICWHSGGYPHSMVDLYPGFSPARESAMDSVRQPISINTILCNFLFSSIPERFPHLKVVFAASGINWLSFQIEVSDHEWERICRKGPLPYTMDTAPSVVFHRQCFAMPRFEKQGMQLRSLIGVDNLLWHSEFPMEASTWPRSAQVIEEAFAGVPDDERDRMLSGNVAKLYKV